MLESFILKNLLLYNFYVLLDYNVYVCLTVLDLCKL